MARIEMTSERGAWLQSLQVGDEVMLETLLGLHRARIQKRDKGLLTVKISGGQDSEIKGWEVKVKEDDGVGTWPNNIIHPFNAEMLKDAQDELVLEFIGEEPKDVPLQGWEAA